MLAYDCKCAEQLKFKITISGGYNMGKPVSLRTTTLSSATSRRGTTDQAYRALGYGDFIEIGRLKQEPPYVGYSAQARPAGRGVMVFAKNQKASLADK